MSRQEIIFTHCILNNANLLSTQNYQNWLVNVENIASRSTVVFLRTAYSITEKTIYGVHVVLGSAKTLVRRGRIANHRLIVWLQLFLSPTIYVIW